MNAAKYHAKWTAAIQPHVPEPLLAVGQFSRAGAMTTGLVGMGSGAARVVMNHSNKKKSAGLPQNLVAGLTASHLYLWKYRVKYMTTKLKIKGDPAMVIDRSTVAITVGGNDGFAHRVHFWLPSGEKFELDSASAMGGDQLNGPLLQQLVVPAAPYPQPGFVDPNRETVPPQSQ